MAMPRRLCVLILTLVTIASGCTDAFACGDKFLRIGRSPRFRAYASVHPSAILVYAPRWTPHGIAEFEQMLRRAGHKPVTVTTTAAMSEAFAGGKYNVVITSYSDTGAVRKELETLQSRPALLPVIYKATKAETAQAEAAYRCLLKPQKMTPFQALEEIDRVIDLRLKDTDTTPAAR
jgi:glycosyltransferase involved in cell wall biosynthesis